MVMKVTRGLVVPEKLFVGRDTAADMLDVSTRTIDDAIRDGELEAFRIGRRVVIRRDVLIRFAERVSATHVLPTPKYDINPAESVHDSQSATAPATSFPEFGKSIKEGYGG